MTWYSPASSRWLRQDMIIVWATNGIKCHILFVSNMGFHVRILEKMTALQRQHIASAQKMAVCISYLNIVGAIDMAVMDLYTPERVLHQGIKMYIPPWVRNTGRPVNVLWFRWAPSNTVPSSCPVRRIPRQDPLHTTGGDSLTNGWYTIIPKDKFNHY